ncbi:RNA polymerase sigma-70 factor [Parapedobacter soli]|uniref:RNA polymerase sigma-70 factor n=1 Tax=Parapedobacter soli TaxID=416955 RepID=UPI0021C79664|nr:RNA polymerase sigma-70 factor [Parapedobacter soli]
MASIYRQYTDQELVARLRHGDEAALSEIYHRYWDKLFVVSMNRIGDQQEAEECVQDVLYKLWLQKERLTIVNADLSAYLAVAVRNQVFNRRLKRHRERLRAQGYVVDYTAHPSPELEMIARELQERIDRAIQALPTQCRIVFQMSRKEGKTTAEIADELAISKDTVKYHLKKANRDIRGKLGTTVWLVAVFCFF